MSVKLFFIVRGDYLWWCGFYLWGLFFMRYSVCLCCVMHCDVKMCVFETHNFFMYVMMMYVYSMCVCIYIFFIFIFFIFICMSHASRARPEWVRPWARPEWARPNYASQHGVPNSLPLSASRMGYLLRCQFGGIECVHASQLCVSLSASRMERGIYIGICICICVCIGCMYMVWVIYA